MFSGIQTSTQAWHRALQISFIVAIASAICLGLLAGFLLDTSLVLPAAITGLVVPCAVLPWMTFHAIDSRRQLNETLTALEGLAKMDTTTHLPNRAAFRESGKAMFDRLKAGGEPLSAVLIDVDHLDQINQTHGYDLGDAVLAHAAELLNLNIQTGVDLAARYGGAEFILLLPQADEGWASAFAERLRGAFANRALEHKGAYINVSASFGVAALQPGDGDLDDLIRRAGQALRQAKSGGRNKVHVLQDAVAMAA